MGREGRREQGSLAVSASLASVALGPHLVVDMQKCAPGQSPVLRETLLPEDAPHFPRRTPTTRVHFTCRGPTPVPRVHPTC